MDEERLQKLFDFSMIFFSLLVIPVVYILMYSTNEVFLLWATIADIIIWSAFLLELVVMISVTKDKKRYLKNNWINLLVIILAPPLPTAFFHKFKLIRLLRLSRLIIMVAILRRGTKELRHFYARNTLIYVLTLTALLTLLSGFLFSAIEDGYTLFEGAWWDIETIATVGYGDIWPKTFDGRLLAIFVIFIGVALMSVVTATISAYFVSKDAVEDKKETIKEIKKLREEINNLKEKIDKMNKNYI